VQVGDIITGKFRIERVVGSGGMGTVVVATHLQLSQTVALKFLHPELAARHDVVERFLREGRAAAALRGENVCRVSDVGITETGAPFLVMELLDGEDLGAVVARQALDPVTAAGFVVQACIAIAEAHALGIIHRDLKPSNLFVARRVVGPPIIKVLDFGIAKAPTAEDARLTSTAMTMGSPGYMSPEQLRSARAADPRSDIWSLGVILFELVSRRLPFPGGSLTEVAVQIATDPPAPLAIDDARYARVVMRCLEKAPERRYQTVAELARELAECGGPDARTTADAIVGFTRRATGPTQAAPPVATLQGPQTTLATGAAEQAVAPGRPRRSRAPVAIAAGAVVAAAAAVVAITVAARDGASSEPATSPRDAGRIDASVPSVVDAGTVAVDAAPSPAELAYAQFGAALSRGDLDAASKATLGIPATAPEHARADAELAAAVRDAVAAARKPIDEAIAAHACRRVIELTLQLPTVVRMQLGNVTCTPATIRSDATVCSDIKALKARADAARDAQQFADAERAYSVLVTCGDASAVEEEYLAACRGHDFASARKLEPKLSNNAKKRALVAACASEGYVP
jgi:serine/threonine-protein kinase